MNKLDLTQLGGDPLALDDIEFLQNSMVEVLSGLASIWKDSTNPIIISGLEISAGITDVTWSDGYIVVNNEVFFVTGATLPLVLIALAAINIGQTVDTNGDEVFEDLSTHSTYLVRRGIVQSFTGSPSEILIGSFITIKQCLVNKGMLDNKETSWQALPTLHSDWVIPANIGGYPNTPGYRINKIGEVQLKGVIVTNNNASINVFTLPVGYRPSELRLFMVNCDVNPLTPGVFTTGIVYPDGLVKLIIPSGYINACLENIRFTP